jgi:basic amino acid/polyamine antiporter, APA family
VTRTPELVRGLGPWGAASLVVGTIIGTGVFLKTAVMAQLGGSSLWVLVAWAVAGLLSLAGAMTYAELGGMFPRAGGEYVYLRRGYGPGMGFLYAWNRFWVATPGSIAAFAVGSATFLGNAAPLADYELAIAGLSIDATKVTAIGFVLVFTAINCLNVRSSGNLQTAMTALKVLMVGGIAAGAFFAPAGGAGSLAEGTGAFPGWSAFGAMVIAALWAYDGWNNLPMAAGEVRDPQRNVPRAIVGGTLVVFAVYALVNIGYFFALPFDEVATSSSTAYPDAPAVAAKVASLLLGDTTQVLLAVAMTVSALSAMHGSMLAGARVPYAVARDNLAPRRLAHVSEGSRVPTTAVLVQGGISIVFASSGRFDELTDTVVFASWLFYALNAGGVIVLRRRDPDRPRPFRVPGFPVVPIVFVAVSLLLLVNTVATTLYPSLVGLGVTALGAVVYAGFLRGRAAPDD